MTCLIFYWGILQSVPGSGYFLIMHLPKKVSKHLTHLKIIRVSWIPYYKDSAFRNIFFQVADCSFYFKVCEMEAIFPRNTLVLNVQSILYSFWKSWCNGKNNMRKSSPSRCTCCFFHLCHFLLPWSFKLSKYVLCGVQVKQLLCHAYTAPGPDACTWDGHWEVPAVPRCPTSEGEEYLSTAMRRMLTRHEGSLTNLELSPFWL